MFPRFSRWFLSLALVVSLMSSPPHADGGPRDAQWKQVDEAVQKGLPQTAIERLQPIITAALNEKAYPEAVKAIGRKIALEGTIQGNKAEERITRLETEIAKLPDEAKPVTQALLATWYWHYFQQNRWRFMQRTATAEAPSKDFTTWDLPRLFAEIDKHFSAALSAEAILQKTPVESWSELLQAGSVADQYRPTLYDFVAHEALTFYASGEQAGAKAEDAFELAADSPVFSPIADFLAWKIATTDESSPTVKALRLYQKLATFHQADANPAARLAVDLDRFIFGSNKAVGEEKKTRYIAALKKFAEQNGDHEISAMARYYWASALNDDNQPAEAHAVASQGAKVFPQSAGGQQCQYLIKVIELPMSEVTTERVWNDPWPSIDIQYRNITELHFRLVKMDWAQRIAVQRYRPEQLTEPDRNELLRAKPAKQWKVDLPATPDYKQRLEEIAVPRDVEPGFYFLVASRREDFSQVENNWVTFCDVWISQLAVVMRTAWGAARVEGFVLDAKSGEPIANAEVRSWLSRPNNQSVEAGPTVKSDAKGFFRVEGQPNSRCLLLVKHNNQTLGTGNELYLYPKQEAPPQNEQTIFFLDRAIYRPGQTVQYKGIALKVDTEGDNYSTLAKRSVTVVFADVNGKEIARKEHQTNDYGSFSGSFTAPRDRLMGQMHIRVDGGPPGQSFVRVEEYKRPKFKVELDAPKIAAKLNSKVSLQGKALSYTGAAIDGAKVRFRVERQVRYPIWWGWVYWWRMPAGESQEIAHGNVVTGTDGSFTIEFNAKPDATVAEKDEPTFQYSITADVTDTTGETRTGSRQINVGYTALAAELTADAWQTDEKPVEIELTTKTLDGEGQQAEGKLTVYRLKQPEQVERSALSGAAPRPRRRGPALPGPGRRPLPVVRPTDSAPPADLSNPNSWELADAAFEEGFTTDAQGRTKKNVKLAAGVYRVVVETQDRFGKKVTARLPVTVLKPDAEKLNVKVPNMVAAPTWTLQPGDQFVAVWGTGYDAGRAFVEIEHRNKVIESYWTPAGRTQVQIKQAVQEAMRGGFTVRVTQVRENRAYLESRHVDVPWKNKDLTLKWEHFVSKLEPAQKETWTLIVSGPDAKQAVAEMVATLYDESLDTFQQHDWQHHFNVFRQDHSPMQIQFENMLRNLQYVHGQVPSPGGPITLTYRRFPEDLTSNFWSFQFLGRGRALRGMAPMAAAGGAMPPGAPMAMEMSADGRANRNVILAKGALMDAAGIGGAAMLGDAGGGQGISTRPTPDLGQVSPRKNLNETAFFFPQLVADEKGQVKLVFTMPEALTQWKFMGFAHDQKLRAGYLQDKVVTAKELMIQPNPPRFLREGDQVEFTVKVTNQSPSRQEGTVRLTLADARTNESVDAALGNSQREQSFDIPSQESRSFSWRLAIPDGVGPLTFRAVGSTGRVSDGEEAMLPVLSRRILVTESLPLPIRGPQTKTFDFSKLRKSGESDTLKHQSLTVQMVSNPSWYAVMALPYLMEYPHECTEQTFNRLYANSLARHIAQSDPKINRVFEQWRGTPTLDSPLEKNQDLKAVMIEETPWLRQANKESESRRNVGILFDNNRLDSETERLLQKLQEQQLGTGAWPWFPGGPPNDYITLYITTGFGRLRHLGVKLDVSPAIRSLERLDLWIDEIYREILKHGRKEDSHLSPTIALYLYGRTFFLEDKPIAPPAQEAFEYFRGQARKFWLKLENRQSQGHLAIALKRLGDKEAATDIMKSLKERSVTDEELGRFWRDTERSWWWYRAPIETQALMIEAFDEVMKDAQAVEECQVWLLKQKQTQDWKTTKATADAVYGLLLRGTNALASDVLVELTLGDQKIQPEKVEAGTGFYEQKFLRTEVKPDLGQITVKKTDKGVAWGSVHWQYLEDMSKVTPYEGTPLKLKKSLFIKEQTNKGPVLKPVAGPVAVGDELVVRIELRTDRDMEYVHLKDYRGSGTEPVNVLSSYKFQDGLGYYESTRDTASHFFIDYLPKGVYVFEYSTRVQLRGKYQTGMAQIQCMYAPEFNSHSESIVLEVK